VLRVLSWYIARSAWARRAGPAEHHARPPSPLQHEVRTVDAPEREQVRVVTTTDEHDVLAQDNDGRSRTRPLKS
jgi:hypothetical protein